MAKIGATLEDMTRLKAQFDQQVRAVDALQSAIDGQLATTDWVGGAATRFRDDWNTTYKRNLTTLKNALTDAGVEVAHRRDMLQQAGG